MPQNAAQRHSSRAARKAALADFHDLSQLQDEAWLKHVFESAGVDRPSAMPTSLLRYIVRHDYDLVPDTGEAVTLRMLHERRNTAE